MCQLLECTGGAGSFILDSTLVKFEKAAKNAMGMAIVHDTRIVLPGALLLISRLYQETFSSL